MTTTPALIRCAHTEIADIALLVPNPRNPNKHPDSQIQLLAKIMAHQGWRSPIVVSNRSGFITKGHGRLAAAKLNGWASAPIDRQDYATEADEWADMVADNKIAELAETDMVMVNDLALELPEDFDLELLGIPDFEIAEPEMIPQADEDGVGDAPAEPRTKRGDIYQLGRHRLMCGDSTSIDDVEKLMAGAKADMVFTDPPYGMEFQSNSRTKTEQFRPIENDDKILDIAPVLWAVMNDKAAAYICTRWDVYPEWFAQFSQFDIKNCVVWHKRGGGMGDLKSAYSPSHEFMIVAHKGSSELRGKRHADVWEIGKDAASSYAHPTQKPVELPQFAIENHSDKNDSVLDLFGGSGSTLIACEKVGRTNFSMELDPKYCDVIVNRWEKYTGQKATLVNG
jgi:DNA modification methylase